MSVGLVRELYGIVEMERATLGMLVTTSSFTKGAADFARSIQHRLSLKDYSAVLNMLECYKNNKKDSKTNILAPPKRG